MEILSYKDFEGSAELDMERQVCRGQILFIDDVVTYESKSIEELQKQFEEAVDDYVETCRQIGKEPQKPCRGQFNVRVSPELHKAATRRSITDDSSLNDVVRKALEAYLATTTGSSVALRTNDVKVHAAGTLHRYALTNKLTREMGRQFNSSAVSTMLFDTPEYKRKFFGDVWEPVGAGADQLLVVEQNHAH